MKKDDIHISHYSSLEAWMMKAIENGNEKELLILLKLLPDQKKEKYRELWKKLKEKK
jgi:hypothetical protein